MSCFDYSAAVNPAQAHSWLYRVVTQPRFVSSLLVAVVILSLGGWAARWAWLTAREREELHLHGVRQMGETVSMNSQTFKRSGSTSHDIEVAYTWNGVPRTRAVVVPKAVFEKYGGANAYFSRPISIRCTEDAVAIVDPDIPADFYNKPPIVECLISAFLFGFGGLILFGILTPRAPVQVQAQAAPLSRTNGKSGLFQSAYWEIMAALEQPGYPEADKILTFRRVPPLILPHLPDAHRAHVIRAAFGIADPDKAAVAQALALRDVLKVLVPAPDFFPWR